MDPTAKLLGVSTPGVQAWIEWFAKARAPKPEPEGGGGRAPVIGLDEMGHELKKRPTSPGCGRPGIGLRGGSSTGSRAVVTEPPWSGSSSG